MRTYAFHLRAHLHVHHQVIILLPQHINLIFLSATIPNTQEFADWVGRIKRKKIHVISTMKRPVPLEHFLWAGKVSMTNSSMFRVVTWAQRTVDLGVGGRGVSCE